jgi:hypothetical protein
VKARAVWVRMLLLVFVGLGAVAFSVQAACSSGTPSGYGYGN